MDNFLKHLKDKSPAFQCHLPMQDENGETHLVNIRKTLPRPAKDTDLQKLADLLGQSDDDFIKLYSNHNGLVLYSSRGDEGFELYPIKDYHKKNREWKRSFDWMEDDQLWEFQKHGVAIGEIRRSGNYFVYWEGKIYYSDHDGGDDTPFGNNFSEFLERIAVDPAKFLYEAGCYTRYEIKQWIPFKYISDSP